MKLNREKIVPNLKQEPLMPLFSTDGNVYSIKDFAKKYFHILGDYEQSFIIRSIDKLNKSFPDYLSKPLTVILPNVGEQVAIAKSIGSRSVYWSEHKLKLKGCRPRPDLYFPHEQLDFGDTKMVTTKLPFGTLSVENVMREILAYSFFSENKLPFFQTPYAVFEYKSRERVIGYCLIFKSSSETRLESKEYFHDMTIKDLIRVSFIEKRFGIEFYKRETSFRGVCSDWYSENKSRILSEMNFDGGFRGILNSNLGNDIKYRNKYYICDFDTFKIVKIPERPSKKFINNFCLWCIVEILKTSPLIMTYVDIEGISKQKATMILWNIYISNSSLWKAYESKVRQKFTERGWSLKDFKASIDKALKTNVVHDLILDNVITSKVLRESYKPEQSFYVPHDGRL